VLLSPAVINIITYTMLWVFAVCNVKRGQGKGEAAFGWKIGMAGMKWAVWIVEVVGGTRTSDRKAGRGGGGVKWMKVAIFMSEEDGTRHGLELEKNFKCD
jgi:hypothetical protein